MIVVMVMALVVGQDLDSPDPAVARRAIEAAIRKGDEKALEAASKTSRGARLALAEVRAHKRFGDAYPPPLSITFEAKDRAAAEVASELSKLLERPLILPDGATTDRVSLSLRDSTFLESIPAIEEALGVWITIQPDALRCSKWRPGPREPASYWRHFKVSAGSYSETKDVLGAEGLQSTASVYFSHWTDGRARIVGSSGLLLVEVVDSTGQSLTPDKGGVYPFFRDFSGYQAFGTHLQIKAPGPLAGTITLKGVQRWHLPEKPRIAEISLADRTQSIQSNNVVIRIEDGTPDASSLQVVARIADWKQPHVRPLVSDFQVEGRDGRRIPAKGSSAGPVDVATYKLTFDLPGAFEPIALKIRVFESVGEHETPFEIRDIPIR